MFGHYLEAVRSKAPLIHNITNYVTANDCANLLLACGASPIMADDPAEVAEVQSACAGLHLNLGTLHTGTVPALLAAGCALVLWLVRKPILMLSLGESAARSLGLDPALWRALVLSLTTLMVAAVVSVCGAVAFVGLIAPHIAFSSAGGGAGLTLPSAACAGRRCCWRRTCPHAF